MKHETDYGCDENENYCFFPLCFFIVWGCHEIEMKTSESLMNETILLIKKTSSQMYVGRVFSATVVFSSISCSFSLPLLQTKCLQKNIQTISTIIIRNHDVLEATMWFPVFQCFNTSWVLSLPIVCGRVFEYMKSLLWIVSTRSMCYINFKRIVFK